MLTDLQTLKLTRYFHVYDIDDDGRIERSDFERIIANVELLHGGAGAGARRGLREAYLTLWDGIRRSADADADGSIDLDEWLGYWQRALEDDDRYEREVEALTGRLFTVFDLDEDDALRAQEFADFFGVFGLSVALAETVFVELDADGDGMISRDELLAIAREFYRGDDVEAPGNHLFGPYGA